MCYSTNCGREGAFGTCYPPEDCIMRAIERDAEENLAARLVRDTALSREHFPCPNCLEQGERHSLTYENGLFTCPECGGETADGMPQVRHKPQVCGLSRVRVPATEKIVTQSGGFHRRTCHAFPRRL